MKHPLIVIIAIVFCLIVTPTVGGIYKWKDENGKVHFSDSPPPVNEKTVLEVSGSTDGLYHPDNYPDWRVLRKNLDNLNFAELDEFIAYRQKAFEQNPLREEGILRTMMFFSTLSEKYRHSLNKWIKLNPNSFIPYLALGMFESGLGQKARGKNYINSTPLYKLERMDQYFERSINYFNKALSINSKLISAHVAMINIHGYMGNKDKMRSALRKAISVYKYSMHARATYIIFLDKRWGGSFKDIEQFAEASQKYAKYNPHIRWLKGYLPLYQALHKCQGSRGWKCKDVDYLDKALKYGDNPAVLFTRAKALIELQDYNSALGDLNRLLVRYPLFADALALRSSIWKRKGQLTLAGKDRALALDVDPNNKIVKFYR